MSFFNAARCLCAFGKCDVHVHVMGPLASRAGVYVRVYLLNSVVIDV